MEEEEFEEELNRPSEPSPLNQKWCKEYPEDMWQEMLRITEESADRNVEMGASIRETGDPGDISKWKLAAIHSGNAYSVTIPRLRDSTGVFHTHPFGVHYPTGSDIIEMIANEDKVICIGRGGYSDVVVNCYGKPIFQSMENRTFELLNRVEKFNSYIKEHYSGITGQNLRLWLAENDEPSLVIMRNLEQEKNQLQREAGSWSQQLFEHKQDCRWSR